jgi:hypothetical protein
MTLGKSQTKNLDLGLRKVSPMNFSKVVTLPKAFTDNYLDKEMTVRMSMTHDGRLVLTPVHAEEKKGGKAV